MKRKLLFAVMSLALLLGTLTGLAGPAPVRAADIRVTSSTARVDFPMHIYFSIAAESGAAINDIRLHYTVERMSVAQVTSESYLNFQPGTRVSTEWDWDMRKTGGLPPGSRVKFWWTVKDASGTSIITAPQVLEIADNRYSWKQRTDGLVALHWYRGDDAFVGELVAAIRDALSRVEMNTGARPDKPINIYIYGSADDLRGSMIFPQEWTGGVAFTSYSTVAIGIAPADLGWGKRAIAHELTHLVIHQIVFSAYGEMPTWLDEGLAMNGEGSLEDVFLALLYQAITTQTLDTVRSIASPFPADPRASALAYAESYSIVNYLVGTYGQEKMFDLLKTFKEGATYDDALQKVYGFDMDSLNEKWSGALYAAVKPPPSSS
ncbi:MAG: peptidase MA family metallohydrolase [Chloroflexota bacterium]